MNKYANLAKQRVIAPNACHVLQATESRMLNRQLINTSRGSKETVTMDELILNKRGSLKQREKFRQNLENPKSITTRKSSVARRKLFVIDNNDDDGEGDMIIHGTYILFSNILFLIVILYLIF